MPIPAALSLQLRQIIGCCVVIEVVFVSQRSILKFPFSPVAREIAKRLPNEKAIKDMVLTGVAYMGIKCLDLNLIKSINSSNKLHDAALGLATQLTDKDRHTYYHIRNEFRSNIASHTTRVGVKYIGELVQED